MADTGAEGRGLLHRITGGVTGRMVDLVDPDILLDQVDVDALISRIDADALLARIDMNALLARVDLNELLGRIDPDVLLDRVDMDALLARVDVDALLARIDPNDLMSRVDVGALLARIDPDDLMSRVDIDALIGRVDMNALLDRVDVNALVSNVDLEGLVRRSGVPQLVAESTNQLAGSAIDLVRRQLVALDVIIDRFLCRLLRRDPDTQPVGPPLLLPRDPAPDDQLRLSVSGHYAGPVTRAASAALDVAIITTSYTLGIAGLSFLIGVFTSSSLTDLNGSGPLAIGALALWAFTYSFSCHAVAGRTVGKGIVGIRVVSSDGSPLSVRQAFVRTVAFPLSALLFGIGFLMILVQREHRALHDLIAGTCSVYDWGERSAEMPGPLSAFLARQSAA